MEDREYVKEIRKMQRENRRKDCIVWTMKRRK
jgi:hypothetical protein